MEKAERQTAGDRLGRILFLLPAAARDGGASLADLAAALEIDERQVLRDVQEVSTRAFYLPAGSGADVQIGIEADRVQVWLGDKFKRPPRLARREALALDLGLRMLAADAPEGRREAMLELARRLAIDIAGRTRDDAPPAVALRSGAPSADEIRTTLLELIRERRRCRIRYAKPAAEHPDDRILCPYVLVSAEGRWYLLAGCDRIGETRTFRLDRIIDVAPVEDSFEVPAGFDPERYINGGRVYQADEEMEVVIRYSAAIAGWIREQATVDEMEDGSVVVRHLVADPQWIVRHVLQYGPDAEVLAPPEIRRQVREAAQRVTGEGHA